MPVSKSDPAQLPLKGWKVAHPDPKMPEGTLIEGMGGNRVRIHVPLKSPKKG